MAVVPPFRRIGIAGLGLIGGSVAMAARAAWPDVSVVGCDHPERVDLACSRHVVTAGVGDPAGLGGCDLIVIAVPMAVMRETIRAIAASGATGLVTDVGSTKRGVMTAAAEAGVRAFVGGHPMAGGERPGLDHARADLFVDRPWLLVDGQSDAPSRARMEAFVRGLGARPSWMEASAHDRTVAYVSHLPQVIATALMSAADAAVGADGPTAAGPAFAEMTRLASSPPDMWQRVLADNADFVAEALERFAQDLPTLEDLRSGAWARHVLANAGNARARWRTRPHSS